MVFNTQASVGIWNCIGQHCWSRKLVTPLPSWWHLPSEAVTTALALVLLLYGKDPSWSISKLLQPRLELRSTEPFSIGAPIRIIGFSAGSLTGLLSDRLLIEREHLLK